HCTLCHFFSFYIVRYLRDLHSFPTRRSSDLDDVHILEHLDRLVEIFNVCWPMYAAMPAILKEAIERAYVATGWDLVSSENKNGRSEEHTSELQSRFDLVCRLLLEKKKKKTDL